MKSLVEFAMFVYASMFVFCLGVFWFYVVKYYIKKRKRSGKQLDFYDKLNP